MRLIATHFSQLRLLLLNVLTAYKIKKLSQSVIIFHEAFQDSFFVLSIKVLGTERPRIALGGLKSRLFFSCYSIYTLLEGCYEGLAEHTLVDFLFFLQNVSFLYLCSLTLRDYLLPKNFSTLVLASQIFPEKDFDLISKCGRVFTCVSNRAFYVAFKSLMVVFWFFQVGRAATLRERLW